MARWNYDFFETSGARIILYFEGHEFNRGRELLLNCFSEDYSKCANYLNLTAQTKFDACF